MIIRGKLSGREHIVTAQGWQDIVNSGLAKKFIILDNNNPPQETVVPKAIIIGREGVAEKLREKDPELYQTVFGKNTEPPQDIPPEVTDVKPKPKKTSPFTKTNK